MNIDRHVKCPLILSHFNESFNFLNRFSENTQISNLMKVRSLGAELFHADGWADMTKAIVAFRSSANGPKVCHDL